jgi:ABC-type lipoprotein release transport system permease subunit
MSSRRFLLKFGYRNLWRAPKRTLIMLLSLALGTGFIIWDLNFARSGSSEVMKLFLKQYAGRYHITHPEYYSLSTTKVFDNTRVLGDDDLGRERENVQSTRRVTAPVFFAGLKKTLGVLMTGIEVEREARLTTLTQSLVTGRWLAPDGDKEVVLGRRLAEKLQVSPGDELAVIGQGLDGSVANDLFQVVGLLDFGGGDLEDTLAFTQFHSAHELMVVPAGKYHQRVGFDMESAALPVIPGLAVTHWEKIFPEVAVSIQFVDTFTWVISVIIVLVISLGLSNTLMITFLEREKEFQGLNVIGASSRWVTKTLLTEVSILGVSGIVLGCLLGHLATLACSIWPINLKMFTKGQPILMGGMTIEPLVKFSPIYAYYWQVPLLVSAFLLLAMIYPVVRVIRRSSHAV